MKRKLRERAQRLAADLPAVFLALKRPETPLAAKLLAGAAVAYALSPVDLIPDFIPVLGCLDDLLLLPALVALAVRLIPPAVFAQCRSEAETLRPGGMPKKWRYALPVLLFWLLVICLIVRAIRV